jgi:hypothetical protein
VKETAVPTNLTDHLAKSWPERKLIDHHAVIPVGQASADPEAFLAQVETDVAVQVAIGLTHDQWVMLGSSGPRWWLHPDGYEPELRRPWDREREPFATLPEYAALECEITGYAVPTFLDTSLWPFESAPAAATEMADTPGAADDVGQS